MTVVAASLWAFACLSAGTVHAAASVPRPLLLLFPRVQNQVGDSRALVALRTRLRQDGKLEVVSFNPDAPMLVLAASDAHHPEWLSAPVTTDAERQDIARAVGAACFGVVSQAAHGKINVNLLSVSEASSGKVWSMTGFSTVGAASAIEAAALAPVSAMPPPVVSISPMPPPVASAPLASAPLASAPLASAPLASAPTGELNAARSAANLAAVQPLITRADQDVANDDVVDAYALYRQAINLDPLSDVPRLKLAQAYVKGGLPDLALSEAQRALEVAPDSVPIQEFLATYDSENNTAAGRVVQEQALVTGNPQDPVARLDLGRALWDAGSDTQAETQFRKARDLAPPDSLARQKAIAELASLHAATADYDASLAEMKQAGDLSYPLVISVVQNEADALAADMDQARSDYSAGKITRASLYGKVQQDEARAQALADFTSKITPPGAYSRSHLDRVQALTLLAQAAAVLAGSLETDDPAQHDKAMQLEKDAQAEMLTAHASEEKLGLWNEETRLGEGNN